MHPRWRESACGTISTVAGLLMYLLIIPAVLASDAMPTVQQNALIHKHCETCHTDAARSGGLSLQHFDAATAAPSLIAVMLSKLTEGVSLATVKAAASEPDAATLVAQALVSQKMKHGAMGAAGIPIPDKPTTDALIYALASETTGANEWHLDRTPDPTTKAPLLTASIMREVPSGKGSSEAAMYRLLVACNGTTHQGEMQLVWAPVPAHPGTLSALVDGKTKFTYEMGGIGATGPAAISLYKITLPASTLSISSFPISEAIEFPFSSLNQTARQSLATCFADGK